MQKQEKQTIEYWFKTSMSSYPVVVNIKMAQRDEAQAKALFEKMFSSIKCEVIEKPTEGKILRVNEVWEL